MPAGFQLIIHISTLYLICHPGHDILKLYNILVQVRCATIKTKLDIYYTKLGIQDAS